MFAFCQLDTTITDELHVSFWFSIVAYIYISDVTTIYIVFYRIVQNVSLCSNYTESST